MSLDIACIDTICALSSAQGPAAIALVRASGPKALEIFAQIFRKHQGTPKAAKAMHGQIFDHNNQVIDDVMAVYYESKRSFTGEPSFEIHCHGNQIIIDEILRAICQQGARLAEPGEFSMRALLHRKIDLAQAESIADLIHSQSLAAKNIALSGVQGGLSLRCAPVREVIISVLAEIEARMDFPDEELGSYDQRHLLECMNEAIKQLDSLLANAAYALKLHEGVRLVICGRPNAGKSTLLNYLCAQDRAIVHESAGTTRDVIEAKIDLGGVPVVLVDVAGIREVDEQGQIEKIGIEKAFLEINKAHAIIWLADCTLDDPFADALISQKLAGLSTPVIRVLNKAELSSAIKQDNLMISAKLGLGISDLLAHLHKILIGEKISGEIFITRARQRDELLQARSSLQEAHAALEQSWADEVVSAELRAAGLAFDRLFSSNLQEDVLDRIFSEFCIGK